VIEVDTEVTTTTKVRRTYDVVPLPDWVIVEGVPENELGIDNSNVGRIVSVNADDPPNYYDIGDIVVWKDHRTVIHLYSSGSIPYKDYGTLVNAKEIIAVIEEVK
jgi:hypothetical protein